jgi:tricarballylate dehydrogenase
VPHYTADSLGDLAAQAGIPSEAFQREVERFNAAVQPGEFDASVLDGKRTIGLPINKSNWAFPLDSPPYQAFPVECGITFTYGGLSTDIDGQVFDTSGSAIPGLYAVGEIAGTFFSNYAGGSGLIKGAVFGRRAGRHAAQN